MILVLSSVGRLYRNLTLSMAKSDSLLYGFLSHIDFGAIADIHFGYAISSNLQGLFGPITVSSFIGKEKKWKKSYYF